MFIVITIIIIFIITIIIITIIKRIIIVTIIKVFITFTFFYTIRGDIILDSIFYCSLSLMFAYFRDWYNPLFVYLKR